MWNLRACLVSQCVQIIHHFQLIMRKVIRKLVYVKFFNKVQMKNLPKRCARQDTKQALSKNIWFLADKLQSEKNYFLFFIIPKISMTDNENQTISKTVTIEWQCSTYNTILKLISAYKMYLVLRRYTMFSCSSNVLFISSTGDKIQIIIQETSDNTV